MTSVVISLLIVAIIVIFFLYLKYKTEAGQQIKEKAASESLEKQKAALEDARILRELELRKEEGLHKSSNVQESIDNFKSAIDDLN